MGRNQNMMKLMAYARTTGSALKFEEVADGAGRVVYRAVINGQRFAVGVGKDKKEARKNAAKIALDSLKEKENQRPVETVRELNHRSLLNEYAQKNRMVIKAVETSRNASPCCSYVVGGTKYPSASGKTKKEAKEEAAKLAYHEINDSRTAEVLRSTSCEAGEQLPLPRRRLEFSDGESNKMTAKRDCVASNHPKTQDTVNSDETSIGDSHCVTSFRNKSEFDSIEPLGKGGFGNVFKAREKLLDKFFAIKIVPCKDKKALREVQALCELDHSNVIRYFSSWMDDTGCPWDSADDSCSTSESDSSQATTFLYIQMDLCDTKTLKAWIDEYNTQGVKKSLPNSKRRIKGLDIILQIVSGLEYIHSKMLIHRDLTPSNILFKGEGNLKIADFGLVTTEKDHNHANTDRTVGKGTPVYMAPEQKCETYDRKVDIFALGLIYFELLWKISTCHEKTRVFIDMKRQIFSKEFSKYYFSEYVIIKPMLSLKPEDRPEASALKTKLEYFKRTLDAEETVRHGNRSV